jgi:hypothetical protein
MTQITINTVSGSNFPYTIYVCDVYGSNCVLVSTILGTVPPTSSSFILPPPYNAVPALMLKVIDNIGCETYKIIYSLVFSLLIEMLYSKFIKRVSLR